MKPSSNDHPELTAYALGELNSVEAARVRQMLTQSPDLRAEYEDIAQTIQSMRAQVPAIPKRTLNPRQRETILAMGQLRPSAHPARDHARRLAWGVAKLAAAASVTAGAFALGMKYSHRLDEVARLTVEAPAPQTNQPSFSSSSGSAAQLAVLNQESALPAQPHPTPTVSPAPTVAEAAVPAPATGSAPMGEPFVPQAPTATGVAPEPAVAAVSVPSQSEATANPEHVVTSAALKRASGPVSLKAFALVKTQPESSFNLQPKLLRPKIQTSEFAGLSVAAPMPDRVKNAPKPAISRKEPQPTLVVHSWKAEIASCPWDSSRRLMRLVTQIPVDQAAVETNDQDYRVMVKFDPAQVQGYRLVMEKHMAPSGNSKLATRFAWYEIVPAKNFTVSHEKPVTLGVMEISQPRNAAASAINPPLKLVDRGSEWNESREDFMFETAMVGFNLLLQGSENVGALNHRFVLDLAQQSKGEDPNGERTKFIHAVQQAQKAAGL